MNERGSRRPWRRAAAALAALLATLLVTAATGCGAAPEPADGRPTGHTLTMWTRAATEAQTRRFIDAYNALGRNSVELRVIPNDTYQQQIATAAGGDNLPDILGSDVVYVQKFIEQGLLADITGRIDALDFADALVPAHLEVATAAGARHAVPHALDLSVLFYNRVLYERAGLDPDRPPRSLTEMAEHAARIQRLGGEVSGAYLAGQCQGCLLFTLWPSVWAGGGEVLSPDGTSAHLDAPEMAGVFAAYRGMAEAGVLAEGSRRESGATWITAFQTGNIGVAPMSSTFLGRIEEGERLRIGVAPIPGADGGASTFVGGDVVGITSTSRHPEAAWDFISWTLGEEAQLSVLAANSDVPARTDLADAPRVRANERLRTMSELVPLGRTPRAVEFGATFNDPQGPWLTLAHNAVFGPDLAAALAANDPLVDASLAR
ncbi:ABC transporter substrate-binding protein [Allonocardiopsis opalescens]|uniref:Carbohydrate ABC transporter substrate-binding protein (CUT1 family) n=1 Tax=Allonocardiopsis opalescens TaxID=1144618 RepID=A0A2T0PYF2_9ACTN|nr:sugar ABC transporter substrate-binding protein [Allonocardiopsis opalescens]PRX96563.1 carbohydrate ABC transporter substrate-binding protein (CUT1 family) [Allonocardiopsis opalescens]